MSNCNLKRSGGRKKNDGFSKNEWSGRKAANDFIALVRLWRREREIGDGSCVSRRLLYICN